MKLECVRWFDHCAGSGWRDIDYPKKMVNEPFEVCSIGWNVAETRGALVLASSIADSQETLLRVKILKKDIVKRWTVADKSPLRKV